MSVRRGPVDLYCDGCGEPHDGAQWDAQQARAAARECGWVRRDGKDLCDTCCALPANRPKRRDVDLFGSLFARAANEGES